MFALCAALLAMLVLVAPSGTAAVRRTPTLAPADTVVDGPSSDITGLNGMAISRDGMGGLVYLKNVGGVAHVFVSRLLGGSFTAPTQVDPGLVGPSSQPVIAAGQSGTLLVAFINAGTLYVSAASNSQTPFAAPTPLYAGASNPSLSMSTFGKAYLAFTAVSGSGSDVRAAFYYQGQWSMVNGILDASGAANAGSGPGRPRVATSGDGIGIVVWGENGHVYSRRIVRTALSTVSEQADPASRDGWQEVSAGDPAISTGGDSSYATVAFQELLSSGGAQQSRVFINRLHGSRYDGIYEGDGTAPGGEGADQPSAAVTEYGAGFVTSEHASSHELYATSLNTNERPAGTARVDSLPNAAAPDAAPATAGLVSNLIAWQQTPGSAGSAEIRFRYAPDGSDLGAEQVASSPALGATDADQGLFASGDIAGDAAMAWIQGTGAGTRIVAAQLYQAPGPFVPRPTFRYATSVNPILSWSPSSQLWGGPLYDVTFDATPIVQTRSLSARTPIAVANGRHTWVVTAANQAGLRTTAQAATVFVDTVAPRVSLRITGTRRVGAFVHLSATFTDSPPPLPASAASGIASTQLNWGDGFTSALRDTLRHAYQHPGSFTVTVVVKDRAGNRTIVQRTLRISPRPRPRPRGPGAGKGKGKGNGTGSAGGKGNANGGTAPGVGAARVPG